MRERGDAKNARTRSQHRGGATTPAPRRWRLRRRHAETPRATDARDAHRGAALDRTQLRADAGVGGREPAATRRSPLREEESAAHTTPRDERQYAKVEGGKTGSDPSAGSPTETLLRLLLPLNVKVYSTFRKERRNCKSRSPKYSPEHSIGRSDGRCVQRAGT